MIFSLLVLTYIYVKLSNYKLNVKNENGIIYVEIIAIQ